MPVDGIPNQPEPCGASNAEAPLPDAFAQVIGLLARIAVAVETEAPEGLRAADAAAFLGISRSEFYRLNDAGLIPAGVEVGGVRVWGRTELREWLRCGAPSRPTWIAIRGSRLRRTG